MPTTASSSKARLLLIAGLLAGIVMVASGVLHDGDDSLPPGAIARVNDRLILRDAWLRAVAMVSSERRTPLTEADKRHILDRLIDEELLAQHGLALGLVEQDRRLRGQLVQQAMQTASAAGAGREFSEDELRRFYAEHQDFFTPPARLRVSAMRIDAAGQRGSFMPPVPDVLLPPSELRSYLGPTLTHAALQLQPGETSEPIPSGNGHAVLEVLAREAGKPPP
ncbi:MAG: peptidylprolyl isomerase, partial [Nevskiales bacterium]